MKMIAITCCCLFAAACASRPLDGGDAPTGIYLLEEARTSDCSLWVNGSDVIEAQIISDGKSTVNLWFANPYFPMMTSPDDGRSWGGSDVVDGSSTSDVTNCNVNQHRVITIEAQSADTLTARVVDTFSNVANLTQPCHDVGGLPPQDCSVTTELRYSHAHPCAAACIELVEPGVGHAGPPAFQCGC
jgi:hypothetical protein